MQPLQIVSVIIVIKCSGKFLLVQRSENKEAKMMIFSLVSGKILGERLSWEKPLKKQSKERYKKKLGLLSLSTLFFYKVIPGKKTTNFQLD